MVTDAATGINQQINYQARLLNAQGATVADGTYNLQFKIYKDGDGQSSGDSTGSPAGTLLWTEKWQNSSSQGVTVKNGYFSVQLGAICALSGGSCQSTTNTGVDFNQSVLWLSVNVGGTTSGAPTYEELLPMRQLAAAPYALNSNMLGGMTASQFLQLAPNVVQGDATTNSSIFINKTGSSGYIIELQSAGSDVATISKTGVLTLSGGLTIGATSVCDSTGSVGCVAKSGSGYYIHNQTGTVSGGTMQSGNIALQGGSSSNPTAVLAASASGSNDILDLQNSSGTNVVTVGNTGNVMIQPSSPSPTAFLIQNAGVALFTADTSNKKIILNSQSTTNPILVITHSDGTTAFEIRTGGTGNLNTYLGAGSGATQTSGQGNTGVGAYANASITSGSSNEAMGYAALYNTSTGTGNVGLGEFAQYFNTSGSYNTAVGYRAGYLDPDGFNSASTLQNTTSIGAYSIAQASNTVVIGGAGTKAVNVGIGTTIPTNTLSVAPIQSNAGTASQTGTTITGSGTSWDTTMIGDTIIFSNGVTETITAVASTTSMTGSVSQTVGSQAYRLHYPGLEVSSSGQVGIGQNTPTRPLDVAQNSTQVTAPMALFEQSGTGDATIEFRNNNSSTGGSFYVGQDTSNSNAFTINSSTAAKSSQATPAHVQTNSSIFFSSQAQTTPVTFTGANTAGNLIVATATWDDTNSQNITCSDTAGNTYTTAIVKRDTAQVQDIGICYAPNIKAAAAGNVVSVNYGTGSANVGSRKVSIHEYSGVATSNPVDVTASNVATGATGANGYTTGSATTNQDGDLIFGLMFDDPGSAGTVTAGTSPLTFAAHFSGTDGYLAEEAVQSTAGSISASFTDTVAHNYVAAMVAFKRGLSTGSLTDTNTNSLFSLSQTGGAKFQNVSNSTNAFLIQNASGTQVFNVDTSLGRISIGNGTTGSATPATLVLNSGTVSSDPTGVAGAMYYNANTGNFRCYNSGVWQNCIGGLLTANTNTAYTPLNGNTAGAQNFATTGSIAAGYCTQGRVIHIVANGVLSTTTTAQPISLQIRLGSTTIGAATTAYTPAASLTNKGWGLDFYMTCDSALGSGSVTGQGWAHLPNTTAATPDAVWSMNSNGATGSINTNNAQTINVSVTFTGTASASNTITLQQLVVQGT